VGWAPETAHAAVATFEGAFPGEQIMVAAAATDADGTVTALGSGCPADGRFELGSVTKTLTGTLLASLAGDGLVGLDDEVGRWLAAGPNAGITLRQLATHTSGLPRLAPNHQATHDEANPYARYTAELAEEGLRQASRTPDAGFGYSNFGYQLLGLALERAAGRTYQALLNERILGPLAMTGSGVGDAGRGTRLPGHAAGKPAGHWDMLLPGPGGVEGSIGDVARYLRACLAPPAGALGAALRLAATPQLRIDEAGEIGLGWIIRDGQVRWHNGATGGFAASAGFDPDRFRAVAILVSTDGRAAGALDSAVLLALGGGDLREARPQAHEQPRPDDPVWESRAREAAGALLDGRFAAAHGYLAPLSRARLGTDQLERGWRRAMADAGEPGEMAIWCRPTGGGVGALVTIACARRAVRLAIAFDPSGQITGLRLLRPGEPPPW
jgi:serine-type D-Ala-D-Ala carboxypeptidase/endopeptidase